MFDKILPQQKSMSTKLGGLLVLVGETMFLFSLMNFLMITRLQYYSEGDSFIRTLFPHYLFFVIALFLVAFTGMWFAYVYIIPSKQKFSQEQAVKDARSPMYNRLIEVHEDLKGIDNKLQDLSDRLDELEKNSVREKNK